MNSPSTEVVPALAILTAHVVLIYRTCQARHEKHGVSFDSYTNTVTHHEGQGVFLVAHTRHHSQTYFDIFQNTMRLASNIAELKPTKTITQPDLFCSTASSCVTFVEVFLYNIQTIMIITSELNYETQQKSTDVYIISHYRQIRQSGQRGENNTQDNPCSKFHLNAHARGIQPLSIAFPLHVQLT